MKASDKAKWRYLIKKYPEIAGRAWELYMRDKKKEANPTTYFNFANKLTYRDEANYQKGLDKYKRRKKYEMELENEKDNMRIS